MLAVSRTVPQDESWRMEFFTVANWIISLVIYYLAACTLGALTCIGFFLLVPISVVAIVFPILGGLKARDGVLWKYPITITFLK